MSPAFTSSPPPRVPLVKFMLNVLSVMLLTLSVLKDAEFPVMVHVPAPVLVRLLMVRVVPASDSVAEPVIEESILSPDPGVPFGVQTVVEDQRPVPVVRLKR